MNLAPLEEQYKALDKRYEQTMAYFDMSTQRMRALASYFDKIRQLYHGFVKKIPALNEKGFEKLIGQGSSKPMAPGNPGLQKIHYLAIFDVVQCVVRDGTHKATFLQESVINTLNDTCQLREKLLEDFNNRLYPLANKRSTYVQQLMKEQSQLNDIITKLERQKVEFSNNQNAKSKVLNKMKSELMSTCEAYRNCLRQTELTVTKFNDTHLKFVKTAKKAIKTFTLMEPERVKLLFQILNQFPNTMKVIGDNYENAISLFKQPLHSWEDDLIAFVSSHGIVRTSYYPRSFSLFQFSFEDSQLLKPILPVKQYLDAPLYVATVKSDFNGESIQNGISVSEGDRLFVYDNARIPLVMVAKETTGERKYIPSNLLEICNERIAVVKNDQLPHNIEFLPVVTGEVVIVTGSTESGMSVMCRNLHGEKGMVNQRCLIIQ
ncbi:hypothetical protein TRFO_15866 [Tritrichomonas foetus]|uniref:SH3 domain containing protein n=1 Tax=Tritrichomonas foetus TaxID=1144522 RepID=A0A1J4KRG6_9EUKA|nr:hypothetical protein TRFO_15866 [Tritrichomonas foetus]|eukprot:OHT13855.1 hypothetical protein TRFO_15866 [Tritrichomonas foetus]